MDEDTTYLVNFDGSLDADYGVPEASTEVRIRYFDADQNEIVVGDWEPYEKKQNQPRRPWAEETAPENAHYVAMDIRLEGQMLFDAAMIELGDTPGEYFDGQFFGADTLWAGNDPFNASSRYYPSRSNRNHRVRELLKDFLPLGQSYVIDYFSEIE